MGKKSSSRYGISIFLITWQFAIAISQGTIEKFYPQIKVDSILIPADGVGIYLRSDQIWYIYDLQNVSDIHMQELPTPEQIAFYFSDQAVDAVTSYQSGLLLSMGRDLYYYDENQPRKWSIPLHNKGRITHLTANGNNFYVLAAGELFYWNQGMYDFQKIVFDTKLTSMSPELDPWNYLWVTDGQMLYRIGEGNEKLPEISVKLITQPDKGNGYHGRVTLSVYHPDLKSLKVEYQLSSEANKWHPINPHKEIQMTVDDTGIFDFVARATVNQKHYRYTSPIKIQRLTMAYDKWWWVLLLLPISIIWLARIFNNREKQFKQEIARVKQNSKLQQDLRTWQSQTQQLQMNPHFIFNALNSINSLIVLDENNKARHYLQKFSTMMRRMLSQSNQERISLDQELKYLEDYLCLEQFSRGNKFTFSIVNEIENDVMIPPMLIQPILENAIIHGFKNIDYPGKITLTCKEADQHLMVTITDNGVGFAGDIGYQKDDQHQSVALDLIQKRLQNVSKFNKGAINIEKIRNHENKVTGTQVILKIPF